jgi:hypothetical protein
MQFGLDSAKTAYNQSQDDRNWMLGRRDSLSDAQDTMVNDAKTFNTQAKEDELAGKAEADVNSGFASARSAAQREQGRHGVNINSGKAAALDAQMEIEQSKALAGAANSARTSARLEGRALTDRSANALAGYPAMSMTATGAGANYGTAGTGLTSAALAGMNSGQVAAGGAAGQMGGNAAGMYGAEASYKNGADQIANANNPMSTILGAASGAAGMYGMSSLFPKK